MFVMFMIYLHDSRTLNYQKHLFKIGWLTKEKKCFIYCGLSCARLEKPLFTYTFFKELIYIYYWIRVHLRWEQSMSWIVIREQEYQHTCLQIS